VTRRVWASLVASNSTTSFANWIHIQLMLCHATLHSKNLEKVTRNA
jgi:hypothetical protein